LGLYSSVVAGCSFFPENSHKILEIMFLPEPTNGIAYLDVMLSDLALTEDAKPPTFLNPAKRCLRKT
jgi:hypothetical protein